MRLEEHQISVVRAGVGVKEMIEASLEYLGGGGIARDVAAEIAVGLVRAHDHRQRVPPNDRRDPLLHRDVAGKRRLSFERNRIAIRPVGRDIGSDTELLGLAVERRKDELGPLMSRSPDDRTQARPAIRRSRPDRRPQGGLLERHLQSSSRGPIPIG